VRRLVALLVIALLGATLYGLSNTSSGIKVNDATISNRTFRAELNAIATTPNVACYVTALAAANFVAGAGGASISATGASAWANLRIEGLAIDQYAVKRLKFHPTPAELARAQASLESELTQAASSNQPCPGTAAQALAAMPAEMRAAQIKAQAASVFLIGKLNATIPLTPKALKAYYDSHTSSYDTICVSIALMAPTSVNAFVQAQKAGASVATLARKFSVDASGVKGGAYGCYAPSNSSYSGVRSDTASTPLDTFPATPQYINYNGGTYALFVAPTKRTTTPFKYAALAVLADVRNANASSANTVKQDILYQAAIAVDPAFGRWGLGSTGPSVFAPATPATADVSAAGALTSGAIATYK
jgi:hypothetical protein